MSCDSSIEHFNLLCGLLGSIKGLKFYSQVDINIINCGMKEEQIVFLNSNFRIKSIKDIKKYDIKLSAMHTSMIARTEPSQYFEEYQYYFYLDADTWIQDENTLDEYLQLAMKQGIAASVWFHPFANCYNYKPNYIADALLDEALFSQSPCYNSGVFCIDVLASYNYFKNWNEVLYANLQKGNMHFSEEISFNIMMAQNLALQSLSNKANFPVCVFIDMRNKNNIRTSANIKGSLLLDRDGEVIGILHLCDNKAHWDKEFIVYETQEKKNKMYSFKFDK